MVGKGGEERHDVRRSSGVKQDVAILEILGVGTVLQVLLQAVAALVAADGRDGRLVDDDGAVLGLCSRHDVNGVSGRGAYVSCE
jgi:hypothetical protein